MGCDEGRKGRENYAGSLHKGAKDNEQLTFGMTSAPPMDNAAFAALVRNPKWFLEDARCLGVAIAFAEPGPLKDNPISTVAAFVLYRWLVSLSPRKPLHLIPMQRQVREKDAEVCSHILPIDDRVKLCCVFVVGK